METRNWLLNILRRLLFLPYLWGMETQNRCVSWWCNRQFLPYLWGMETERWPKSSIYRKYRFLPYLWGMETIAHQGTREGDEFRSYRTYEEWKHHSKSLSQNPCSVLTVPMRNGNPSGSCVADPVPVSSYRTYEEWKPGQLLAFNSVLSVLTVPMRNGNNTFCSCAFVSSTTFLPYLWGMETESPLVCTVHVVMFLPYLWGMETATNRPSKGRKWVLTVPMRNGNVYSEDELISRKLVLTVPMRNGNQWGWSFET